MPVAAPMGRGPAPTKRAKGKPAIVGGTGNKDSELALLMPGETVIPTKMSQKYGGIINAMIADKVPGYKRGVPTTGTAVDIPGGFAAAHFGGSSYRSGAELLQMVEGLDTAFARQIRTMVAEVEGGLGKLFTVFTNEVTATSTELNRAVGKTGSGKTAPIALAKQDLIGAGAATRDIELQRQLEAAGTPIEEIRSINKKVTNSIESGFKKLGDKAVVTAEELDKLVDDAYAEVSKTDDRVRSARTKMREVTAVTDPRTDSRVPISKDPYTKFRKSGAYYAGMERSVGSESVPYTRSARFKITNPMASQIGLSSRDAALVYNQFSKEVKVRLASLKGDISGFSAEFAKEAEKAGIKTGNAYKIGLDKTVTADPYVESRDRKSPHRLASQDGRDDARAYAIARDKELKRQSGRTPRVATRVQGPAPIGATPQPGMTVLPIVPSGSSQPGNPNNLPANNQTRSQRFIESAKSAGGKMTGMGGGMGLLGVNMGLSMVPDFAGKGILQGATAGANLGMFFGPQGMALGATIGAVTSAFTGLIAKQKEHAAITKSTFTVSNSLITAFGDKVLDTSIKITELSKSSIGLKDIFGILSPEVQAIIDDLKNLPEDDPLAIFIKKISKERQSLSSVTGNLRSKVTTDIALGGLDPKNAQKYVFTLMSAAGKVNDFGAVWESISKDVINASTATTASFNKLGNEVNKAGGQFTFLDGRTGDTVKKYEDLRGEAVYLADQMFSFFKVLTNGSFTFDEMQKRIAAFDASSVDARTSVLALESAIAASGSPELVERFSLIKRMFAATGQEATATAGDFIIAHHALEMFAENKISIKDMKEELFGMSTAASVLSEELIVANYIGKNMKGIESYIDGIAKARKAWEKSFGTNDYEDYNDGTDKAKTTTELYIDVLEKEIKELEAKRDAQKNANDETQRQIDLQMKLKDLAKESVLAKISGDYIKAASLQQQAQNVQVEFNKETDLRKKDAEIDRLKARVQQLSDGANPTKAEIAKIPKNANRKGAASGGMIRGAGTGTSDSIPAYLSNGEYVIKADSVKKYGVGTFDALNTQKFKDGGPAYANVNPSRTGTTNPNPNSSSSYKNPSAASAMGLSQGFTAPWLEFLGIKGLQQTANKIFKGGKNKASNAFYSSAPNNWDYLNAALLPLNFTASGQKAAGQAAAKAPSLIGSAVKRAAKSIPGSVKELSQLGIWNTLGKIKPLESSLYKTIGFKPRGLIDGFKNAYKYSERNKSFFTDIIENPRISRKGGPGAPQMDEVDKMFDFSPPQLRPMEAFGELSGLISNFAKKKISSPISKKASSIKSSIASKFTAGKENVKFFKEHLMPTKSALNPIQAISNMLYRYTPYGTAKAKQTLRIGEKEKSWAPSALDPSAGPEFLLSLKELAKQPFYHGGILPENLLDRSKPGSLGEPVDNMFSTKHSMFGNLFDFDLFTTGSKGMSSLYSRTKNTTGSFNSGDAGDIYEMFFPNLAGKSTLDLRGGQKSIWSQNKRAYAKLESFFIKQYGLETGRLMLAGERIPGIAHSAVGEARDKILQGKNLRLAFTQLGPSGFKYLIDTILHEGGRNTYSVSHPVVASLAPTKMVSGLKKILEGVDLRFFEGLDPKSSLAFTSVSSELEKTLTELVARAAEQKSRIGKTLPFLKEGHMNVPKYAMGGLIKGPGTGISDSIRAGFGYAGGGSIRVSNGEYVVKASSVRDYGVDAMNSVNNGTATIGTNSGGTVYNINMPITSNNANPEGVANEVMRRLKLEVSKNNKSNKVGL
jgi:hypothetical protein